MVEDDEDSHNSSITLTKTIEIEILENITQCMICKSMHYEIFSCFSIFDCFGDCFAAAVFKSVGSFQQIYGNV